MPDLEALQTLLGYKFANPALLQLALTHPSLAHEQGAPMQHNQRLEFLGDAVLQLVLTRDLYERYPAFGEGPLTKARAKLVNRHALADLGNILKIGEHLVLSRGEESHGGRERSSTLADALEAVLGAVFLDGGFPAAERFIARHFHDALGGLGDIPVVDNPKGELQELLQTTSTEAPQYHVVDISGPEHDRVFACTVHHEGRELARGEGKSKKDAEGEAARAALQVLRPRPDDPPGPH